MSINELSPKDELAPEDEASGSSFAFGHRKTPSGAELIDTIVEESTYDVETELNSSTEQLLDEVFTENKSLRSSLRQKSSKFTKCENHTPNQQEQHNSALFTMDSISL